MAHANGNQVLVSELMSQQGTDDLIRLSVLLLCVAEHLTRTFT